MQRPKSKKAAARVRNGHFCKKFLTALSLLLWFNLFPIVSAQAQELTISAAVSLKEAFMELGRVFEGAQKRTRLLFNFGASGGLARQIAGGAPVDVFASAGLKEMLELEQKGLVVPGSRVNFAGNEVVLITPAAGPFRPNTFSDLVRSEIRKIAVGNPATVPAGRYAKQALKKLRLWEPLKDKLVFAENVRQVLDYVVRNEVDAGLVYATDAIAKSMELKIPVPAPEGSHSPIVYPLAAVKGGERESLARAFIALVVSKEGQRILGRHGFKPPEEKK
jgi:molybdate transport system substrate-binding protein